MLQRVRQWWSWSYHIGLLFVIATQWLLATGMPRPQVVPAPMSMNTVVEFTCTDPNVSKPLWKINDQEIYSDNHTDITINNSTSVLRLTYCGLQNFGMVNGSDVLLVECISIDWTNQFHSNGKIKEFHLVRFKPPGRPGGIQVLEATISWRRPTNMNEEVDLTYTLTIMDMAMNTTKVYQNITEEQFKVEELPECCAVAVVATNAAGSSEPSHTFHSCKRRVDFKGECINNVPHVCVTCALRQTESCTVSNGRIIFRIPQDGLCIELQILQNSKWSAYVVDRNGERRGHPMSLPPLPDEAPTCISDSSRATLMTGVTLLAGITASLVMTL